MKNGTNLLLPFKNLTFCQLKFFVVASGHQLGSVACRGREVDRSLVLFPQFWLPKFSKGRPFGIILQYAFLDNQPQKFTEGAFGANIVIFEGGARAKKRSFLVKFLKKYSERYF